MKKLLALLMAAVLSVGLIAGCAQKETGDMTPDAEMTGLDAYTAENPLVLKFWNFPNFTGDAEFASRDYDAELVSVLSQYL